VVGCYRRTVHGRGRWAELENKERKKKREFKGFSCAPAISQSTSTAQRQAARCRALIAVFTAHKILNKEKTERKIFLKGFAKEKSTKGKGMGRK
jgi:hypothetical protein